ncbi:MAG: DUF1624 domain-containing protein [Saprospiraceae bacterium]|nr:DUF1624 domain-containing protein [Saprospiraceae bacterium]
MGENKRLISIDVLRGMTIAFMIIVNTPGSWEFVYAPLRHAPWDGCTPTDLVFPFFLFIVGLSMAQSFKSHAEFDKKDLLLKALKRTLVIFGVGLLLNWFPFYNKPFDELRIFGVLQRISLAYFFSACIAIYVKENWHLPLTILILIAYYLLLIYGVDAGPLTLETNLVRVIDLALLGENHIYHGYGVPFDPEGLLSTMGSIGNVMFGFILARKIMPLESYSKKIQYILLFGILLISLGVLWNFTGFPINKPIWSGSYAMFTSGLCSILFAAMIYVLDQKGISKWSFPFVVFGMNALASYALSGLVIRILSMIKIGEEGLPTVFYNQVLSPLAGPYMGSLLSALLFCSLIWLMSYTLYRKGIFIKA